MRDNLSTTTIFSTDRGIFNTTKLFSLSNVTIFFELTNLIAYDRGRRNSRLVYLDDYCISILYTYMSWTDLLDKNIFGLR